MMNVLFVWLDLKVLILVGLLYAFIYFTWSVLICGCKKIIIVLTVGKD